ncbi:MAG: hypothetical protein ACR2PT_24240 [Endozoicomonas sp.]
MNDSDLFILMFKYRLLRGAAIQNSPLLVIPAQAGIYHEEWIPACAGMTLVESWLPLPLTLTTTMKASKHDRFITQNILLKVKGKYKLFF